MSNENANDPTESSDRPLHEGMQFDPFNRPIDRNSDRRQRRDPAYPNANAERRERERRSEQR